MSGKRLAFLKNCSECCIRNQTLKPINILFKCTKYTCVTFLMENKQEEIT